MATPANTITAARRSAFIEAVRRSGDTADALLARAPGLSADAWPAARQSLESQLVDELLRQEATLLPSRAAADDGAIDAAAYFVRRRRLDLVRRRASALRGLPGVFRKLATLSADDCGRLVSELGTSALARAMKSIRPAELPAALQRLGPDAGRQVLQRVMAEPADWPNELRRFVRGAYLAAAPQLPGPAVLHAIGQAVLAAAAGRLSEADRAALHATSACDLRRLLSPADDAWQPFADECRLLLRQSLARVTDKEPQ